jgi:TonB-linked SusC/RagA family outer membrane protein
MKNYRIWNPIHFPEGFKFILLTMKLSLVLTLVTTMQVSANLYSQNFKMDLSVKDKSIKEILKIVESKSTYRFFYSDDFHALNKTVSISLQNSSLDNVMDAVLNNTSATFKILENNVVVISPNVLQQQKVSGKVIDSLTGEALPGVSVTIEGTTAGTITDLDGSYSISVMGQNQVLVFSFVGYLSEKVQVTTQSVVDVKLVQNIQNLEEVVVVGYGTTTRKNLTTSISKIDTKDVPVSANSNVNDLLMGRAAGLQAFQGTSQPGGKVNISIRGGGNPLIVVDGVVMPTEALEPNNGATAAFNSVNRSGLGGLNPEDIESVEILKDASAAIYGVNAANGVILITTKKGKEGNLQVSYSGSHSWVTNYPYFEPLDATQYMQYYNSFVDESYAYANKMAPYGSNPLDLSGSANFNSKVRAKYTQEEIAAAGGGYDYLNSDILRSGSIENHTLTFTGGSQAVSYYFSGNYYDQKGTVTNSGLQKYNVHLNLETKFLKILKFGASVNANRNNYQNSTAGVQTNGAGEQSYGAVQAAINWLPTQNALDPNGRGGFSRGIGMSTNPLAMLEVSDKTTSSGVLSNFTLDAEIIPKMLTAKVLFGNNYEYSNRAYHIPGSVFYDLLYLSRGNLSNATRNLSTLEGMLSFNKGFGSVLNLNAVAGIGKYTSNILNNGLGFSDFPDILETNNAAASVGLPTVNSNRTYTQKRSVFGRLGLDILDKYIISGSLRYDGVDKFYPEKKYAFFPSVSAAWKISSESFLKNNSYINLLKLRGSYGTAGNNNIGANAYGTYQASTEKISFSHGTKYYIPFLQSGLNYPDLTWEKTVMLNAGIDFSLLKDRISGSVDVFRNKITTLLDIVNTDPLSFLSTKPVNGGTVINTGYEFSINTVNIKSENFNWNMSVIASHYYKHWEKRFESDDIDESYVGEKDAVDIIYYRPTSGIISDPSKLTDEQRSAQNNLIVDNTKTPTGAALTPGMPLYSDENGDGVIDNKDIKSIAKYPKLYLGWGNTFMYKNFDLDIFLYGQFGFKKYNQSIGWANNLLTGINNSTEDIDRIWSMNNPSGDLPGYAAGLNPVNLSAQGYTSGYYPFKIGQGVGNDIGLEDASFLRCRNITIGYNFSIPSIKKYLKSLKVYFDVQNAFIITKYKGIDPEIYESLANGQAAKGGPGTFPMARTWSVGVKANF